MTLYGIITGSMSAEFSSARSRELSMFTVVCTIPWFLLQIINLPTLKQLLHFQSQFFNSQFLPQFSHHPDVCIWKCTKLSRHSQLVQFVNLAVLEWQIAMKIFSKNSIWWVFEYFILYSTIQWVFEYWIVLYCYNLSKFRKYRFTNQSEKYTYIHLTWFWLMTSFNLLIN